MEVESIINIAFGFAVGILLKLYLNERQKVSNLADLYHEEKAKNAVKNTRCPEV